jgi:hypothetical protein
MTTTPQRPATSSPGITSLIPARIDRLPRQRRAGRVKGLVRPGAVLAAVVVFQLLFCWPPPGT